MRNRCLLLEPSRSVGGGVTIPRWNRKPQWRTSAYSLLLAYNSRRYVRRNCHATPRGRRYGRAPYARVDTRNATEREYAAQLDTMVTAPDLTMSVSGCALPFEASWHAHTHTYPEHWLNAPLSFIAYLRKIKHALDHRISLPPS